MNNNCEHKNLDYADGMVNSAEPPYDGTDFWWSVICEDCDAEIAEGDGYSQPEWVKELASGDIEK